MRVYVEHDMTVCHLYHVVELKAGTVVESPLADYLVESGCDVTVEDAPAPEQAAEQQAPESGNGGAPATEEESHTPGSGEPAAEEQTAADETAEPATE